MFDLVAVGDVMLDVRLPAPLGARLHASVRVVAGGSAVNAACAAARLGARAAVVGAVGDDPAGWAVARALERAGVTALLEVHRDLPTGTVAYVDGSVVADRGAGAGFRVREPLPAGRVTLVSGYLPFPGEGLAAAAGLRAIDTQGVSQPFDADVVLGPDLDLAALAPRHQVVCATLGAQGARAARGEERAAAGPSRLLPGSPTGAGDMFAAAFLLALAEGLALEECLRRGCGVVVEHAGTERHEGDPARE